MDRSQGIVGVGGSGKSRFRKDNSIVEGACMWKVFASCGGDNINKYALFPSYS